MTGDPELDAWKQQWQARDAVPQGLRLRVEREIRGVRYQQVVAIAITVLFGGTTVAWALVAGRRDAIVLAAATWTFITINWLTTIVLSRRVGQPRVPAAPTTTAFLDFAIQNCRRKRDGIAAAAVLAPIFLAFMLVWRYQTLPLESVREYLLSVRVLMILSIAMVLGVVGLRRHRALGDELENLRAMRRRYED